MNINEAQIVQIDPSGTEDYVVFLEWTGDNEIDDFDISKLGSVEKAGMSRSRPHRGWVTLKGKSKLAIGESIPTFDPTAELVAQLHHLDVLRASVSPNELEAALERLTTALRCHWSTGGGRRVQSFIWSLWSDEHAVNLFDLCAGLDADLGEAVVCVFRAQMFGVLTEKQKRQVLEKSGELARWDKAANNAPNRDVVLYPWPPISVDQAREFVRQAEHKTH
jgi:hypothetical protein